MTKTQSKKQVMTSITIMLFALTIIAFNPIDKAYAQNELETQSGLNEFSAALFGWINSITQSISSLTDQLNAETIDRQDADSDLNSQIQFLKARVTALENGEDPPNPPPSDDQYGNWYIVPQFETTCNEVPFEIARFYVQELGDPDVDLITWVVSSNGNEGLEESMTVPKWTGSDFEIHVDTEYVILDIIGTENIDGDIDVDFSMRDFNVNGFECENVLNAISVFTQTVPPQPEPICGDGDINQPSEQCDDGNLVNGDGCSDICAIEDSPEPTFCGNGILDPAEQCDDGNLVNGDGCSDLCLLEPLP